MDATYNFSLGFTQGRESKTKMPNRLFNQQALQMISPATAPLPRSGASAPFWWARLSLSLLVFIGGFARFR
jgi:hypothetical protein